MKKDLSRFQSYRVARPTGPAGTAQLTYCVEHVQVKDFAE